MKQHAEMETPYTHLNAQHDRCPDLIAALRRQIKETKDALELEHGDSTLKAIAAKVQVETADLQKQLQTRVKLAAALASEARVGLVRLEAGTPSRGMGEALSVLPTTSGCKLGEPLKGLSSLKPLTWTGIKHCTRRSSRASCATWVGRWRKRHRPFLPCTAKETAGSQPTSL